MTSKTRNIFLWITQSLLAASMIWAACMKLLQPIEKLAVLWPWTAQLSPALVRATGIVDIVGAIGLLLPGILDIRPALTRWAAIGVIILMMCAAIFHISRGEVSVIGVNIIFAAMAVFIAWGRR